MEIVAFVKEEQIDPIYFDSSYFALPEKDSEKAYALLWKALEDKHRVAIATVTMHQREYTVFIRPRDHGLTVHTMFFENEIRHVEGYGKIDENIHPKPWKLNWRNNWWKPSRKISSRPNITTLSRKISRRSSSLNKRAERLWKSPNPVALR